MGSEQSGDTISYGCAVGSLFLLTLQLRKASADEADGPVPPGGPSRQVRWRG